MKFILPNVFLLCLHMKNFFSDFVSFEDLLVSAALHPSFHCLLSLVPTAVMGSSWLPVINLVESIKNLSSNLHHQ